MKSRMTALYYPKTTQKVCKIVLKDMKTTYKKRLDLNALFNLLKFNFVELFLL